MQISDKRITRSCSEKQMEISAIATLATMQRFKNHEDEIDKIRKIYETGNNFNKISINNKNLHWNSYYNEVRDEVSKHYKKNKK